MKNYGGNQPVQIGDRITGLLTGALLGAALRSFVTVSFLYCVVGEKDSDDWNWIALVSAIIGLAVGGLFGATCMPRIGMSIGAVLSAGFCFGFVILPVGMVARWVEDPTGLVGDPGLFFLSGLFAMTIAGAIAGGVGSWAGMRRAKRRAEDANRFFRD